MKINDFIEEYKVSVNKEDFVKKHILNKYVPYEQKISLCNNIIKSTNYKDGKYNPNTPMRHLFFVMTLVDVYTDLSVSYSEKTIGEYNMLDELDLIDMFLCLINPKEIKKINDVFNMIIDDTFSIENSIVNYIDTKLNNINDGINKMSEVVKNEKE